MTPEQLKKVRTHTLATLALYPQYKQFIDISRFNWGKPIDFQKVRASGIEAISIKATEGKSIVDSRYHQAYKGAKAAGLRVSPYLFYRPGEDIAAQVALFIATVGQLAPDDLLPTVDLERATPEIPAKHDNELLDQILIGLKAHFGRWPIIYTSKRYCDAEGIKAGGQCFVWTVDYVHQQNFLIPSQFAADKVIGVQIGFAPNVPGIPEGDVDRDIAFVDWDVIALFSKPAVKPAPPLPPIDTTPLDEPFRLPPDLK